MRTVVRSSGFTLIELSVVLVVIALLTGAILVGKDMVKAAQIRQTISQRDKFDRAYITFKNKYNCLPGDCARATDFGLGEDYYGGVNNVAINGNGNEIIGDASWGSNEYKLFWRHLSVAKLIDWPVPEWAAESASYGSPEMYWPGVYSPSCSICNERTQTQNGYTRNDIGGWFFLPMQYWRSLNCGSSGWGGNWTAAGGQLPNSNSWLLTSNGAAAGGGGAPAAIKFSDAKAIDDKMDDGRPMTGKVVATSEYSYSDAACSGDNGLMALHRCSTRNASAFFYCSTNNSYPAPSHTDSAYYDNFVFAGVQIIIKAGF